MGSLRGHLEEGKWRLVEVGDVEVRLGAEYNVRDAVTGDLHVLELSLGGIPLNARKVEEIRPGFPIRGPPILGCIR